MDPIEPQKLSDRFDAMSSAMATLVRHVQMLENQLAALDPNLAARQQSEYRAAEYQAPEQYPVYAAPPSDQPLQPTYQQYPYQEQQVPPQFQFSPDPPPYAVQPPAESASLESKVGLAWANRIGVVTLMIGVAFAFKYLVDNEYIGPGGRVILGIFAGLATLFGGDILWNRGQKIFAQGISALGVSILYLSFYASFGLYHLVPIEAAFALMVLITVIGTLLAMRYNAGALSTLAQIGGYLTPIALSTGQDKPVVLFSYLTMLNAGAVWLGRRQGWKIPPTFAITASTVIFLAWYGDKFRAESALIATVFTFVSYALFVMGGGQVLSTAAQILAAAGIAGIWYKDSRTFSLTLLSLTAMGGLFAGALRRVTLLAAAFSAFWFVYGIHIDKAQPQLFVAEFFTVLTVAFLGFLVWAYWWIRIAGNAPNATLLTVLALDGIAYFAFGYALFEPQYHSLNGLFAVAVSGVYVGVGWMLWSTAVESRAQIRNAALIAAVMGLSFLTLAVPIQFSAWRITLAWSMEAVALSYIAKRLEAPRLYWLSTLMLVLVALRILGVDAQSLSEANSYSLLLNSRFFILAWSALAFWLTAYFFRRDTFAAIIYIAGHVIFWGALALEVSGWAYRGLPTGAYGVNLIAQSILLGLYGVVIVSIGVATHTAINRLIGLAALGLVLVKLYLVDIFELNQGLKIVAFLGLGVILVVTSYVYSRYKDKIAKIWKDDAQTL